MIETIGWVWIGVLVGTLWGVVVIGMLHSGKQADLEQENLHLRWINDELKEEIFRIENRPKPKPRKNRKR